MRTPHPHPIWYTIWSTSTGRDAGLVIGFLPLRRIFMRWGWATASPRPTRPKTPIRQPGQPGFMQASPISSVEYGRIAYCCFPKWKFYTETVEVQGASATPTTATWRHLSSEIIFVTNPAPKFKATLDTDQAPLKATSPAHFRGHTSSSLTGSWMKPTATGRTPTYRYPG